MEEATRQKGAQTDRSNYSGGEWMDGYLMEQQGDREYGTLFGSDTKPYNDGKLYTQV